MKFAFSHTNLCYMLATVIINTYANYLWVMSASLLVSHHQHMCQHSLYLFTILLYHISNAFALLSMLTLYNKKKFIHYCRVLSTVCTTAWLQCQCSISSSKMDMRKRNRKWNCKQNGLISLKSFTPRLEWRQDMILFCPSFEIAVVSD